MDRNAELDGFYAGYMTAAGGNGFALFEFRDGKIIGTDVLGTMFDGKYSDDDRSGEVDIDLDVQNPGGITLIHGAISPPEGLTYKVKARVPLRSNPPFFRVDTPRGPVNIRLTKLRDIPK